MNRTYLSQFIKAEYGCTFYQFVSRYRVAEAKRLKLEQPDLKMDEIAARCGFSSRTVFSNVFTREEGVSPREWFKKGYPKYLVEYFLADTLFGSGVWLDLYHPCFISFLLFHTFQTHVSKREKPTLRKFLH
ncbi:MAG: AraC family transcriptional regulator [Bacteroidales bacterium]|nr:AraC family transcriptional regulator [Bacteroidales bacterium]